MSNQLQIEKLKEKIRGLAKKYKISYAIIFGSFAEERFALNLSLIYQIL